MDLIGECAAVLAARSAVHAVHVLSCGVLPGIAGTNTGVESQFSVALDPSTNISWATTNEFLVVTAKFVCQNCSRCVM